MRKRALALASEGEFQSAVDAVLLETGSAVKAVVGGYFAAAGYHASTLLGPAALLVSGLGVGARCFDGRLRQPGIGVRRPRGFTDPATAPVASRIGVPQGPRAVAVALAYDGGSSFARLAKLGVTEARRAGSEARAHLLERVAAVGPGALSEAATSRLLVAAAGTTAGGLLTAGDLGVAQELDVAARVERSADGERLRPPWSDGHSEPSAELEFVLAVDVRGVCAALAYSHAPGFEVPALGVSLGFGAEPVIRGAPRRKPGMPLAFELPLSIHQKDGVPLEVVAPNLPRLVRDPATAWVYARTT